MATLKSDSDLLAIALTENCLAVPANRMEFGEFTGFQLRIIQEVITLIIFILFAFTFLQEKLAWNYIVSISFPGLAAVFAIAFKAT